MKKLICAVLLLGTRANADVVCKSGNDYNNITVTVSDTEVVVSGGLLHKPRVYKNLQRANGLITGYGFALHYKNYYGCLRMAVLITDTQDPVDAGYMDAIPMGTCSGGSTSDDVCVGTRLPKN